MSKVKVVLNSAGIRDLLKSPEVSGEIKKHCDAVQSRAGDGYASNVISGKRRAVGRVYAYSKKAISDNYENNTLLTAGGRVLGVVARAEKLEDAVAEAYRQVEHVHFDNAYYRKDIGAKALAAKEA